MSAREKIIKYYRAEGKSDVAVRFLDIVEGVVKSGRYKITEFTDPYGVGIAETIKAHYEGLQFDCCGGYEGAERVRVAFFAPKNQEYEYAAEATQIDYDIVTLAIKWDVRYYNLAHRDVLGALVGLGIKREVLGDILLNNGDYQAIVFVAKDMSDFVQQNLISVGSASVSVEQVGFDVVVPREERVKEIKTTVASMRLDAIAASGFGVSRTKMAEEIAGGRIRVNWRDVANVSTSVKEGDIITIRGRGRVEIVSITGNTKKGRIGLVLKRYH